MKAAKAIVLGGVVLGVLDLVVLSIMRVMDVVAQQDYTSFLGKSLAIILLVVVAAILVAVVVGLFTRSRQQGETPVQDSPAEPPIQQPPLQQ